MIFQAARLLAFLLLGIPLASAQTQSEALALMNRAVQASQHTAYLGTFVYQSGSSVETSRIAHYVDADGNSIERLEVLTAVRARSYASTTRFAATCPRKRSSSRTGAVRARPFRRCCRNRSAR
jgi:hypothetical protein